MSIKPTHNTINPDLPAYEIKMRNSGQTPAYAIKTWRGVGMAQKPLLTRLAPPPRAVADTDVILGIGAEQLMKVEKRNLISQQELDAMQAGTVALYVWGRVEYRDVFHIEHFTNFCLCESDNKNRGIMNYTNIGNDAD